MPAYQNAGDLFYSDRLGQISTYPEWTSDKLEATRRTLEELLEKRDTLTEEEFNRGQTNYYWTSYVLRRLGFCHSCSERAPGEADTRPDYTLFYDSADFFRARDYRGSRDFFAQALAVIRSVGWTDTLDEVTEEDGTTSNPAVELDRYLRDTGVNWGILTNGQQWRLYHRDTSGLLSTYYEVDLVEALKSNDLNDFRYFWMVFSPSGLGGSNRGDAIVNRLYD
jgi:hypothetical protein